MRKNRTPKLGFILILLCCLSLSALARPPKVIKATPDNGEKNVAPSTKEIRVQFDQAMNTGGYSICGGGANYPKTIGKPKWIDKKTIVLKVKLEPNHKYMLSINSRDYKNFKNSNGEPAIVYPISFETGSVGSASKRKLSNKFIISKLHEAIYADETEGDLDKAIGLYLQVIIQASEIERIAAKAAYKLGMCYLKKDDKASAAKYFQSVVEKYPSQKAYINKAKEQLDKITPVTKSLFEQIDGQVIRFILEKYGEFASKANEKNLYTNCHVYYVDPNLETTYGGIGSYYNWTGQTIKNKVRLTGTSYPNQSHYNVNGTKMNTVITPHKTRPNHWDIYWIPDEPLAPGESYYYGWSVDGAKKLSSMPGEIYSLTMQNKFGPPAIETFFLVLSNKLEISQSNPPSGSQELLNFNVYWWSKTVQQGENHLEQINLKKDIQGMQVNLEDKNKEKITDPVKAKPIIHKAVMTISTLAENDPKLKPMIEEIGNIANDTATGLLAEYLESPRPTVRRSAIYICWQGKFDNLGVAAKKLIKLCSHEKEMTRGMAALALGGNKEQSAFEILSDMTINDTSSYARRCGAYALGLLGNTDALPILKKALNDEDFNVKNNADAAITMLTELNENKSSVEEDDKIKAAVKSATHWLEMIDEGNYGESWEQAASFFKNVVTKKQWEISAEAVRKPLGKLTSREVLTKTYTKQVPGGPDGQYVIITFKSSYENKDSAIETVTPMLDKDNKWKVSGYYIK